MKKFAYLGILSLAALTLANHSNAAMVMAEFDLQGSGSDVAELNLSEGGLDLTITPDTITNGGDLNGEHDIVLTRRAKGIGVDNKNCVLFVCDGGKLDGFGYNDIALFQFSRDVKIESFTLRDSGWGDDVRLFGGAGFTQLGGKFSIPGNNVVDFAGLSAAMLTGNLFGIAAFDFNDSFRISSLKVSYDAVPIPAALPLMLTGLAGLGIWGRRQKKRLSAKA